MPEILALQEMSPGEGMDVYWGSTASVGPDCCPNDSSISWYCC